MFDLALLRTADFWFAIRWNPLAPRTAVLMAAVFGGLLLCGLLLPRLLAVIRRMPKFERKAWRGVGRPAVVAGGLGLLFTFFAYQQVPLLSLRFWFLFIALGFVVAEALAVRALVLEVPRIRDDAAARAQAAKYLPGKKI